LGERKIHKLSIFFISFAFVTLASKAAENKYISKVKSMKQKVLAKPNPNGNGLRLEGCGPIAGAMVLSNFHLKRGYKVFNSSDDFGSDRHPKRTIKRLYLDMNTRKAPAKSNYDADGDGKTDVRYHINYTMPDGFFKELKKAASYSNSRSASNKKLVARGSKHTKSWSHRINHLHTQVRKGKPVALLLRGMPKCLTLNEKKKTRLGNWHCVVVSGFKKVGSDLKKSTLYLLSGWEERGLYSSVNEAKYHNRISDGGAGLVKCSYEEIKAVNPGLFWLQKNNIDSNQKVPIWDLFLK
jgi:hypothetical protein